MKAIFLLLLSLLGTAPAVAEEWLDCLQSIEKGPPISVLCLVKVAKSLELLHQARHELETRLKRDPNEPFLNLTLALVLDRSVGCAESQSVLGRAADLLASHQQPMAEFYARTNLARCFEQNGNLERAGAEATILEKLAETLRDPVLLAKAKLRRTQIAISAGQVEIAERGLGSYSLDELDILDKSGQLGDDRLIQQGLLNHTLGRWSEALQNYQKLENRAKRRNNPLQLARATYNIAATRTSFEVTEDNRIAIRDAARVALEAAEFADDPEVLIRAQLLVGRLESDATLLDRCSQLAQHSGNSGQLVACKLAEAATLASTQPANAKRLLEEGIAATASSQDIFIPLYAWKDQMRAVFALRPRADALAAAYEFLARIEHIRSSEKRSERRAELFGVWRELYSWLAGRLLERRDPFEQEKAFLLLEQARARELHEALAIEPETVRGLREAEKNLAGNEAMLTFHLGSEDLYGHEGDGSAVFVSTREGTQVVDLPYRTTLAPALDIWLGSIEARGDPKSFSSAMGRLLFGPIEKILPSHIDRLVVVPDGCLYRLPWALLRDSRGELLVQRYEISVAPSASLASRHADKVGSGEALIFADPDFGRNDRNKDLPRLPLARREGEEVYRLLGGKLLEGKNASEDQLELTPRGPYAVMHFAAHAVIDSELPEHSALLLAPREKDDGRLEPREIARLNLSGQLVTLASCRSAHGRILPGEGPMSLGRAFLAAGAPVVIGTLWPLRDDDAFAFFSRFYRHLGQGERAATALATTQREMAAALLPGAAWAGVVLLGDGDFRLEPRSPSWRLSPFWLLSFLALFGGGLVYFRRRMTPKPGQL